MTGYVEVDWARVLDALNNVRRKRWEQRRAAELERERDHFSQTGDMVQQWERKELEAPVSAEQEGVTRDP